MITRFTGIVLHLLFRVEVYLLFRVEVLFRVERSVVVCIKLDFTRLMQRCSNRQRVASDRSGTLPRPILFPNFTLLCPSGPHSRTQPRPQPLAPNLRWGCGEGVLVVGVAVGDRHELVGIGTNNMPCRCASSSSASQPVAS